MSYLVLARKYRPKTFLEMVGQEHVVQALTNALEQQRLHHAYLFTGTRGVGKTTVSRILAKSLNCQGPDGTGGITAAPCGVCQACVDIDAGRFVDYTELDAASNRGVDEVQSLLEQAVYKPVQGRFKVFMIDEVHMLTGHAFNAMLKTLEEPPEYLKFVLATTDPQKVPVTVLSRCLQFNLRPMAPETVQEHLARVLEQEAVPADAQALRLLSRAARGSMRDALSLTDQAIAFGAGQLREAPVRQMLGSVDRSHVFRLIEALAEGDGKSVVEISEALRLHGLSAAAALEEMSLVLQRMAVLQAVPQAADATDDESAAIARLAALMPADETQLLYSMCLHGRAELGLAPDEYAALTMVLLRLLAFKPGAAEKKTLKRPADAGIAGVPASPQPAKSPERAQSPGSATTTEPASAGRLAVSAANPSVPASTQPAKSPEAASAGRAPAAPPGHVLPVVDPRQAPPRATPPARPNNDVLGVPVRVQPEPLREAPAGVPTVVPTPEGDFWQATVQDLVQREAIAALVRELALQAQLVARDEGHWMLRVERESLNQPASRERLRTALQGAGHAVEISVEVGPVTDSPARRAAVAAAQRQRAAEQIILNDPFVQQMQRDFGAKIVPGSIKPIEKH
ncbi:DNA polymerase III subunit gamma/tau [Ramlibacter ginsenosidimutans]|uniref:DNA polymerase III subunit gamma/tau n=1 Tax=Ramlibacter ginsenosidimutans TaxID=502333 RepID=A0A934TS31_9BURK|nr:DNA polymerase III subunit gamma/tau [Ramlibacter ginsenosidimutans]MBK6006524.1 DNA polymerase III subunit gamma/tau [Ramlibacter ginsenosidimutans]